MAGREAAATLTVGDGGDAELVAAVLAHYRAQLWASGSAGELLAGLGISAAVAERFSVGLSDRSLGLRLPERTRKGGKALRDALCRLGLYRPSGHEHLCGCLVVPVTADDGTVLGVLGHRLSGEPAALHAAGMAGGLFNAAAIAAAAPLVVATSVLDALAVVSAGHEAVVGPGRPAGYLAADLPAIAAAGTVVLLGDGTDRLAERLAAAGAAVAVVPTGRPLHALLAEAADPAAALAVLLAGATPRRALDAAPPEPCREVSGDAAELHVVLGARRYRVRGAEANTAPDALRVALCVSDAAGVHLDSLDLCSAKARRAFCEAAAGELAADPAVLRRELAEVLFAVEQALETARSSPAVPEMSDSDRGEALALLGDPDLCGRVVADLHALGVVGEDDNLLCCYLAAVSRKAERPFGVVVQSSSAAGKSTLAEAVLSLVPEEDLVAFSALTGQALYYLGAADLSHKVLAVAEDEAPGAPATR